MRHTCPDSSFLHIIRTRLRLGFVSLFLLSIHPSMNAAGTTPPSSKRLPAIIPRPLAVEARPGAFRLTSQTRIVLTSADGGFKATAAYLARALRISTGYPIQILESASVPARDCIVLQAGGDAGIGEEGYLLTVDPKRILLEARSDPGMFYAAQTLLQLFPAQVYSGHQVKGPRWELPAVRILDQPRYRWRGMMLDVSRHFFPKEFVKEFLDYLAMHKMNVFHWHLNDDQGWRIEIKQYPKLTGVSAWRVDRENLHWSSRPEQRPGEIATYGGYYTQEEIKEIVEYAAERHITVVPEIEMPAHCTAVLAAFPELSCTGGPFTVPTGGLWPIKDIYCGGNDSVFTFIENILTEVAEIFPGRYIHIGGDEANKAEWKRCPKCQARITAESLQDEAGLQSYFITRIESILTAKGKRLIGWDEILEGGLAPEATVMSWRGTKGGIEAARSGHDVIMTPTSFCYFDYYQGDWRQEPIAWGGYIPLKTVYAFEPTPAELTGEEARHVLGAQGNLWAEHIPDAWKVQYMVLPRMAAMSEAVWSSSGNRDWADFSSRLRAQLKRYSAIGLAYARSAFTVSIRDSFDQRSKRRIVTLDSEIGSDRIRYTVDGSVPGSRSARYTKPIILKRTATLNACVIDNPGEQFPVTRRELLLSPGTLSVPALSWPLDLNRNGSGPAALVDNERASGGSRDTRWQGIKGKDLEAVIDLGAVVPVHRISTGFLHSSNERIFLPAAVEYSLSDDGITFRAAETITNEFPPTTPKSEVRDFSALLSHTRARFVKVKARNLGMCPEWHKGAGEPAWLYVDEIFVE